MNPPSTWMVSIAPSQSSHRCDSSFEVVSLCDHYYAPSVIRYQLLSIKPPTSSSYFSVILIQDYQLQSSSILFMVRKSLQHTCHQWYFYWLFHVLIIIVLCGLLTFLVVLVCIVIVFAGRNFNSWIPFAIFPICVLFASRAVSQPLVLVKKGW